MVLTLPVFFSMYKYLWYLLPIKDMISTVVTNQMLKVENLKFASKSTVYKENLNLTAA